MSTLRLLAFVLCIVTSFVVADFTVVDTHQTKYYGNTGELGSAPASGTDFYGQDAHHTGNAPRYRVNYAGTTHATVTDLVTGLEWMQGTTSSKMSQSAAVSAAAASVYAGFSDWRLPNIKEMYSLIEFTGEDPSGLTSTDTSGLKPFVDTSVFTFKYGDTTAGERIIDAQYATTTLYVSTTMNGDATMFGVNLADGRIKGYPLTMRGSAKLFDVKYVRGGNGYGTNSFVALGDGTINDTATGLQWCATDSGVGMKWKEALAWVQTQNAANYKGYSDWRMPNIKELQSIVDYTRSPATTSSPAINALFTTTSITNEGGQADYPFFWSGTTHASASSGANACYVSFGRALGWMSFNGGTATLLDVHGAGAQRSDPKTGDPASYPTGHGPQGDVIRIFNYVRLVRGGNPTSYVYTPSSSSASGVSTLSILFFTGVAMLMMLMM